MLIAPTCSDRIQYAPIIATAYRQHQPNLIIVITGKVLIRAWHTMQATRLLSVLIYCKSSEHPRHKDLKDPSIN
jgi:hypothetical protein